MCRAASINFLLEYATVPKDDVPAKTKCIIGVFYYLLLPYELRVIGERNYPERVINNDNFHYQATEGEQSIEITILPARLRPITIFSVSLVLSFSFGPVCNYPVLTTHLIYSYCACRL